MKSTIFLAISAIFITASMHAQQPVDAVRPGTTVDSIRAKYKLQPMPGQADIESIFPVLGTYQLNNAPDTASSLTVTMDPSSKGIVWIEGLPEGRMKAYLKKSPSTYRILSQKSETGKQIPEGTLIFDSSTKQLNIALGVPYNETDPVSVFSTMNNGVQTGEPSDVKAKKGKDAKNKTKNTRFYTASKLVPMQPALHPEEDMQPIDSLNPQQPPQPEEPKQPQPQ